MPNIAKTTTLSSRLKKKKVRIIIGDGIVSYSHEHVILAT